MSEYTRGPLEFSSAGFGNKSGITVDEYFIRRPEDDVAVAADVIDPETGAPSESNARRLVACWNACQNIATDAIESGSLDLFQLQLDRLVLTQQRDELLSVARRWAAIDAQWHPDRYESEKAELLRDTRALIEKVPANRVNQRMERVMSIQDGGPAFPVADYDHMVFQPATVAEAKRDLSGMSLRDYFAVHACIDHDEVGVRYAVAVVGRDMPDFAADPLGNSAFWAEYRARMRYIEADAMLAARSA